MKTLAVMSRKGGAGKTTVAVNLTLAARAMGIRAVLADADPMRSAHEVLKGREEAPSILLETAASKLFALTEASRRSGCELLIIDTPAAPESDVAEAVKVADLCLAVARPTYLDLAAAVLKAFEALRFANLPVATTAVRARMVYQTAFAQGRSVLEIDAEGTAAREVRALFSHVWKRLNGERPAAVSTANDDLRRGLRLRPA